MTHAERARMMANATSVLTALDGLEDSICLAMFNEPVGTVGSLRDFMRDVIRLAGEPYLTENYT